LCVLVYVCVGLCVCWFMCVCVGLCVCWFMYVHACVVAIVLMLQNISR